MDRGAVPPQELITEIRAFLQRAGVENAIFFGSRARGDSHPHSDLNLILLSPRFAERRLSKLLPELQRHWKSDLYVEFIPLSPEEFEEMQRWNSLAREAAEEGVRIRIDLDQSEETR